MKKKAAIISLSVIAAIIVLIVYGLLDPAKVPFPRCPFFVLTGLKCPGCGTQRALHCLLHLNIADAFRYNALMVLSIPVLAVLLAAELFKDKFPRLHRACHSQALAWGILAAICLWSVARNFF
ncbi:MAG: DUF2752 domain-containing protein [Bacteroidales bacterium]|nr:DUF2752 domain-containing protein [Bacteroidales bacterium]